MKMIVFVVATLSLFFVGQQVTLAQANTAKAPQPSSMNMEDVVKAMGAMLSGGTNAAKAVVEARALKALLPAELPGLKRASATAERSSVIGITVSYAEAVYKSEQGAAVTIKITDMGGTGGLMGFAQAGWTMAEIDKETETGYERTTEYSGFKAQEQYDSQTREGEIKIMVPERFLVEIAGRDIPDSTLKAAVESIDLKKLSELKPPATAPAK